MTCADVDGSPIPVIQTANVAAVAPCSHTTPSTRVNHSQHLTPARTASSTTWTAIPAESAMHEGSGDPVSALDLTFLSGVVDHVSQYLPDRLAEADEATDPLYEKLMVLHRIREERKRLQLSEAVAEAQCAQAMGSVDQIDYPDLHATRRGGKWTRKGWDHPTMQSRLAANLAADAETGEFDGDLYEQALNLITFFVTCASVSGYKVKTLAEKGIEFDDACTGEPGRRTVEVQSGKRDDVGPVA